MSFNIESAITRVPIINLDTTLSTAISLMKENQLLELPLVTNDIYEGLVYLEDIEHTDNPDSLININLVRKPVAFIKSNKHLLDAVKMMATVDISMLPVLNDEMKYIGSVEVQHAFDLLADMLGLKLEGSILVLRILSINYSPAELTRLVESNDFKLLTLGVQVVDDGSTMIVTIKVDKEDITSLLATLYRYEYDVIETFSAAQHTDHFKDRYDQLMRYLDI